MRSSRCSWRRSNAFRCSARSLPSSSGTQSRDLVREIGDLMVYSIISSEDLVLKLGLCLSSQCIPIRQLTTTLLERICKYNFLGHMRVLEAINHYHRLTGATDMKAQVLRILFLQCGTSHIGFVVSLCRTRALDAGGPGESRQRPPAPQSSNSIANQFHLARC
jgi:hypothetical protein